MELQMLQTISTRFPEHNMNLYFSSVDAFRGFVNEVLSKHTLMPETKVLNAKYMRNGITPRSLLFNAHEIMHKYVNKGLS